ncbi:MAG: DUF3267 domain-containing protein [Anaerolineae bacterium]|nr:DUF3267 domain-containing protein [Anaerolineae bacterium]
MSGHIEGYLLIPHELLHVAGYRLVGKRCLYRWGNNYVVPIGPLTRDEELVGLLFPFAVCLAAWLILLPFPFAALFYGGLEWAIGLSVLFSLPLLYASTAIGDLRRAYLLLRDKPGSSSTPFDVFFWPVMPEHARGLHTSSLIILAGLLVISALYFFFFS